MYEWSTRYRAVGECFIPWIERRFPLAGKRVLEFGSGTGSVGCALAHSAGEVLGLDFLEGDVRLANTKARELGLKNVRFEAHGLGAILDAARRFAGQDGGLDVFMLFAVLEHMTIEERLEILRLARELISDTGIVVVCESPNRLLWHDWHTTRTPFYSMLPEELAKLYADRSPRGDFVAAMRKAQAAGRAQHHDAFIRWGRGMSHHEFELALGNLDSVVASNYDFELSPQRHVEREEIGFIGWCDQWMPDLPPSFTRYYIDLILAKRPGVMRKRWSRPWPFETMSSTGVVLTPWQTLRFDAPNAVLEAPLRFPSSEVTLAVECQGRETVIEVEGAVAGEERHVLPESNPACTRMLRVRLEKPTDRVRIAASQAALISSLVYAYDVPTGLEPVVTSAHQADNNAQCSARSSVG